MLRVNDITAELEENHKRALNGNLSTFRIYSSLVVQFNNS